MTINRSLKKAIKLYRDFRGRNPTAIVVQPPIKTKVAVRLGKLIGLIYESDRGGKKERYIHFTREPYPDLNADPDNHRLFTTGGRMKVTKFGLVR